jgi:hypothetical protein
MAGTPEPIGRDEYARRISDLCARGGRHAFPRRARDRAILLHALVRSFPEDTDLTEPDVDARIQSWLLTTGRALEIDHVALRRALVDEWFLSRDRQGTAYRACNDYAVRTPFSRGVTDVDPESVVADAQALTAERKRRMRQK